MTKLGDYMHSTKIWSVFEYQGQKSKVKVTGDKKRKSAAFLFGSRPLGSGPGAAFFSEAVLWGEATPVGKSAHAV